MIDRALTEARLLKAAQRVLLQGGYPNPERTGCPDREILRAIAARELTLEQVAGWADHLSFCSPCFVQYDALRRQAVSRRWMQLGAIAAGIALVVAIGIWAWLGGWRQQSGRGGGEIARREEPVSYQAVLLDLRNRSALRGEESVPGEAPLELPRGRLSLSIYLPIGNGPGKYEFEIAQEPEKPLVRAEEEVAGLREGVAAINVKLNVESFRPGLYLAGIRRSGQSWRYYHVVFK